MMRIEHVKPGQVVWFAPGYLTSRGFIGYRAFVTSVSKTADGPWTIIVKPWRREEVPPNFPDGAQYADPDELSPMPDLSSPQKIERFLASR